MFITTLNFISLNIFSVNKNAHHYCFPYLLETGQKKHNALIFLCNLPPHTEWKLVISK